RVVGPTRAVRVRHGLVCQEPFLLGPRSDWRVRAGFRGAVTACRRSCPATALDIMRPGAGPRDPGMGSPSAFGQPGAVRGRRCPAVAADPPGGGSLVRGLRPPQWSAYPWPASIKGGNMRCEMLRPLLLSVLPLLAASPVSGQAPTPPAAQLEAMKRFDLWVGEWKGSGWVSSGAGQRHEISMDEKVQRRVGGTVLLVEGRGTRKTDSGG